MGDFQHFVPRFYLKGFVDPYSVGSDKLEPYLWVVNIKSKTVDRKAPRNVAGFTNYYNVHTAPFQDKPKIIDNSLTVFETRAAPIIQQIRNGQFQTTVKARYHLANFIGIQLGRVPSFHQYIDANIENAPINWLQEYITDDEKLKQKSGKDAEWFKEYMLSGKKKVRFIFENESHRRDLVISLSINLGIEYAKLIIGMRWVFLLAEGDADFFASDNPARVMSPGAKPLKIKWGELNEELQISFPVSSKCVLWMHSRDIVQNPDFGVNEVSHVDKETVDELNWGILPTIDKYAFCSTEEQARWVIDQVHV